MKSFKLRAICFAAAAAVLFSAIFSLAFAFHELEHECSGNDCPVCAAIMQAEEGLLRSSSGVLTVSKLVFVQVTVAAAFICQVILKTNTLVSFKVKLNN